MSLLCLLFNPPPVDFAEHSRHCLEFARDCVEPVRHSVPPMSWYRAFAVLPLTLFAP